MKTQYFCLLAATVLILASASYTVDESYEEVRGYRRKVGTSRDFVAWMDTVTPGPESASFGHGLKYLVTNMNPTLTQQEGDLFTVQINEAAKLFPDFCNSGDETKDKSEFAAFLSIIGAETSFMSANGFPCTIENGCPNCLPCSYNTEGDLCLENPKLQYYGRGPLQLSWNYNYADYSKFLFKDPKDLVNDPDIVTSTGANCWSSAIWFWMVDHEYGGWCMPPASWPGYNTCEKDCYNGPNQCSQPQCTNDHWLERGKGSCHEAMMDPDTRGFGEVIGLINGGYDCCPSSSYAHSYGHTQDRIYWWLDVYNRWGGGYPAHPLNPVPIHKCPLGKNVNCGRLDPGPCWSGCCQLQSPPHSENPSQTHHKEVITVD